MNSDPFVHLPPEVEGFGTAPSGLMVPEAESASAKPELIEMCVRCGDPATFRSPFNSEPLCGRHAAKLAREIRARSRGMATSIKTRRPGSKGRKRRKR